MSTRLACAGVILVALVPAAAAAPAFDDQRLFTTAAERARLDALRAAGEPEAVSADEARAARAPAVAEPDPTPPPAAPIRLRGFVRRSGGPDAVWVNDASSVRGGLPDELRIHSGRLDGATVVITLPDGRTIRLKPGQTWDPESGRVVDSYRAD